MVIAMIPARIGSQRLARKNLALLNNKPLIEYAIEAAIESKSFDRIVINSDDSVFEKYAKRNNVEFYLRPKSLGGPQAKVDEVVIDFIEQYDPEYLSWVNPTSPFQTGKEISAAIKYFLDHNYDSFVTVRDINVHCIYKGEPVNFSKEEQFGQTQNLTPVQSFVYSICAWRASVFKKEYYTKGYGFFCGSTGYYPVSRDSSFLIKTRNDLEFADFVMRAKKNGSSFQIEYDI